MAINCHQDSKQACCGLTNHAVCTTGDCTTSWLPREPLGPDSCLIWPPPNGLVDPRRASCFHPFTKQATGPRSKAAPASGPPAT